MLSMSEIVFEKAQASIEGEYQYSEDLSYKQVKVDWNNPASIQEGLKTAFEETEGTIYFYLKDTEDMAVLAKAFDQVFRGIKLDRLETTNEKVLIEQYATRILPGKLDRYDFGIGSLGDLDINGVVFKDVLKGDGSWEVGYLRFADAYTFRIEVENAHEKEVIFPTDLPANPTEHILYVVFARDGSYRFLINFSKPWSPQVFEISDTPYSGLYLELEHQTYQDSPAIPALINAKQQGQVLGVRNPVGTYETGLQAFKAYILDQKETVGSDFDPFEGLRIFE